MTIFWYSKCSRELKQLRIYAVVSIALFLFGAIAGGLAIIVYEEAALQLQEVLKEFVGMFRGMSRFKLFFAIFLNNSVKTLIVILLGPVLGLVPVLFLLINGAILGVAIPMVVLNKGVWASIIWIAPHGIIELPAIFLGTSIGIHLGLHALRRLLGKADSRLLSEIGSGVRAYVAIILPMLLLAALIEVFVTPLLASI